MADNSVASVFAAQWHNPTVFMSLLMILGGPVIRLTLAQLTGPPFVPICFSFGWVSYAFSTIVALVGDGRLMPPTDYPCKVFNLGTGYARTNKSWIIGRLLRDLERPLSNEALSVSVYHAKGHPTDKRGWSGISKSTWFGLVAIAFQIYIAIIPLVITKDWDILTITASGTLIALLTAALPQWRVEKFACRYGSMKKIAITAGNGSRHVIVVLSEGRALDLEDMAEGYGPRQQRPWIKTGWFLEYMNDNGQVVKIDRKKAYKEYMDQYGIETRPPILLIGSWVGMRYFQWYLQSQAIKRPSDKEIMANYARKHNLMKQVQLFRGLPKPFWLTGLFVTILILLWAVLLISILALKRNAWYLVAIGAVGMIQNTVVAAASREPDKRGIHLEKDPMILIGEKVQDVLMDLDSWEAGCGRSLVKEFFPAGLDIPTDRGEQDWWDDKASKDKNRNKEAQIWRKQGWEEAQEEYHDKRENEKGKEDGKRGEKPSKRGARTDLNTEKKQDTARYNEDRYQEKYRGRRYDAEEIEEYGKPTRGKRHGISQTKFKTRVNMAASTSRRDVKAFARARDLGGLEYMLDRERSRVAEVYPWVTDLQNARIHKNKIAEAMIQTENVTWEPGIPRGPPGLDDWREKPESQAVRQRLGHTGNSCAHLIIQMINRPRDDEPLDGFDPDPDSPVPPLDRVAQWEDVIFRHCGIGGVLHPTMQSDERYGRMNSHGGIVSVVYAPRGSQDYAFSVAFAPKGTQESPMISNTLVYASSKLIQLSFSTIQWCLSLLTEPFKIRPPPPEASIDCHKHTMHNAQMSDDPPTRIWNGALPNTFQWPLGPEIWDRGLLRHCIGALKAILLAMADLNQLGGCCDSFPVFTNSKFRYRLSTVDIRFEDISDLAEMLSQPLNLDRPEFLLRDEEWRSRLCRWTLDMFEKLFESKAEALMLLCQSTNVNGIASYVLHMTALCAQLFSIGLATFCGGHCSDFYMPQISRPIERFYLMGIVPAWPGIIVEKVELSCLGNLVQHPVWAFKFEKTLERARARDMVNPGRQSRVKHDIEAKISQFLDIWDTTIVINEARMPGFVKLRMGSGFLSKAKRPFFSLAWPDTMLHWSPQDDGVGLPLSCLEGDVKVIVGAITVNEDCLLSRRDCEKELAGSLVDLRTQTGHWKPHTRTTGIAGGFGGGPMAPANLTFNHSITQMWCPAIFRKGSAMQQWNENPNPPLTVLNEPWGLEFSLCTGVARRVPLRALLDETVVSYLQTRISTPLLDTDVIELIRKASSDDVATGIYNHVARTDPEQFKALQLAVKYLVGALQWARLDATKKKLLLWWPEPSRATDQGIELDDSWYSSGSWIPILEDTEKCAVFGLATSRCLEDSRTRTRCRNHFGSAASRRLSKNSEFILYTGIGPCGQQLALPIGEHLVLESRRAERHVFQVQQPATFEHSALVLEYRGVWPRPAVWLKRVNLKVVESAELIELGRQVVVRHRRPS